MQHDRDPEHDEDAVDDDAACATEHHGQRLAPHGDVTLDIAVVLGGHDHADADDKRAQQHCP